MSSSTSVGTNSQDKRKLYIFIAGVFIFSIFSFWITSQEFFLSIVQPLLNLYTYLSSKILNIFGYNTAARAEYLSGPGISLEVKKGCDAIAPMLLLVLSISFFPAPFKTKPKAILVGIGLLFLLNLVRIISLYLVKQYVPSIFDFMHTDIWQIVFIVFTLFLWLRWLKTQSSPAHVEI